MDDEQILAASVGEPPPTFREVVLAEYDPEWPKWFARAEAQVRGALGEAALQVDHVGSTSVPGLAAKPLIDVNLVVADTTDEEAYVPDLGALGYVLLVREPEWYEHRLLRGTGSSGELARLPARVRGGRTHARLHAIGCARMTQTVSCTSAPSGSSRGKAGSTSRTTPTRNPGSCRQSSAARPHPATEATRHRPAKVVRLAGEFGG